MKSGWLTMVMTALVPFHVVNFLVDSLSFLKNVVVAGTLFINFFGN
jgi:hypothetical protein